MNALKYAFAVATLVSSVSWAQRQTQQPPQQQQQPSTGQAGMMDMNRHGPWTRKPADEGKIKKEVTEFFKEEERLEQQANFEQMANRIDFPIYMVTDNSQSMPMAREYSKAEYTSMMKPFFDNRPKDLKFSNKPNFTVLSDALVAVSNDYTMTMGGQKRSGRYTGLLVKRNGQWKWKSMVEAGWGDMSSAGVGGAGQNQYQ